MEHGTPGVIGSELTAGDNGEKAGVEPTVAKLCVHCGKWRPLGDFKRRTGKRSGGTGRRGACRMCRLREQLDKPAVAASAATAALELAAAAGELAVRQPAAKGKAEQRQQSPEAPRGAAASLDSETVTASTRAGGKRKRRRRRRTAAKPVQPAALGIDAGEAAGEPATVAPRHSAAADSAGLADHSKAPGAVPVRPTSGAEETPTGLNSDAAEVLDETAPRKRRRRRRKRGGAKTRAAARALAGTEAPATPPRRIRRPLPIPPPRPEGPDASVLRLTRAGVIKMRGKTDKGRRWVQDTDLETAVNLVREHAAVVVNPHTIRRLYTTKAFRAYVLTRDRYTCYFCGEYGDTIDHLVPRAKGGHTTPINCVCACHLCNQSKADRNLDEFYTDGEAEA